mmetsp:Transcript_35845/g.39966  ORF Transcript_35845/g.39966 Transcript_35845/m.39966 type:complete len:1046 (+) Transcript_35845:384-3521(+)
MWCEVSVRVIPGIREQWEEKRINMSSSENITTEEEFWCNGLDRLTSRRVVISDRSEYSAWNGKDVEAVDGKQGGKDDRQKETPNIYDGNTRLVPAVMTKTTTPNNSIVRRELGKRIDIRRLRDRWWLVVSEQRFQRAFRKELNEKLALVRVCVENPINNFAVSGKESISDAEDGTYNDDSIHDKSISERTCSSNETKNVHLSALEHQMKNSESLLPTKKLIECIIEQNDDRALKDLLERSWIENEKQMLHDYLGIAHEHTITSETWDKEIDLGLVEHAIEIAICHNKPRILRTILSVTSGSVPTNTESKRYSSPLIQSVELGHEECASILLSKQDRGSTLLFFKDIDGNTPLHYCCREKGDKAMLLMLLKQAVGSTKGKQHQLLKLVTARNKQLQTPLHVACQKKRNDLVEVFLTTCKSSLLFKVLSTKDVDNQTPLLTAVANNSCDAVVSLIMWRGNHSLQDPFVKNESCCSQKKKVLLTCPLVRAASDGNLDMIELLIQFGYHSGYIVYQVTDALLVLLRSDALVHTKVKGSDLLMHAGGNPFEEIDLSCKYSEIETTIDVAARIRPDVILRSVISTGIRILRNRQFCRRKDLKLQQQPDVFFRTLESKEDSEVNSAMKNALIRTLFRAYSNQEPLDFSAAIALYERIPGVDETDLSRLQTSMLHNRFTDYKPETKNYCFLTTFQHSSSVIPLDKGPKSSSLDEDRSVLAEKSFRLLKMPWFQNELIEADCFCPWMKVNVKKIKNQSTNFLLEDEVVLIADGVRFLVHVSALSEKSAKLASAIRFERMNRDEKSSDQILHLAVSIPTHFCKLLIQHIYHGSICCGWPNLKDDDMCRYLLELMLIAEEFLMPSLVQEIEMRLLSSLPKRCFCWYCCQAVRVVSSEINKIVVQCLYCVDGISHLVTSSSGMNVLGFTEYTEGLEYYICLVPVSFSSINYWKPKQIWKSYDDGSWQLNKAAVSLKDMTINNIEKNASVVKSPFYLGTYCKMCQIKNNFFFKCASTNYEITLSLPRPTINPCEFLELRILVALKTRQQICDIVILLI